MKTRFSLAVCVVCFVFSASAQVINTSDHLPPPNGEYVAAGPITYTFGGGTIVLNNLTLLSFSSSAPPPTTIGGTSIGSFSLVTEMSISLGGPFNSASAPGTASEKITLSGQGGGVSTYNTELLQLDFSGGSLPAGIMLRESPTLASTGPTQITDLGGGQFRIDSFFDVFTELSVDFGATWSPASSGPTRFTLEPMPEPSSIALAALGGLCLWMRRRKR